MTKSNSLFSGISAHDLKQRKKISLPAHMPFMLATLTNEYFSDPDWIYEQKFDGERCLAVKKKGKVKLVSRNNKLMNSEYPELVAALESQAADNFMLDGEIIAKGKKGVSDFQLLQGRMHLQKMAKLKQRKKEISITYCIFDLLYAGGYDLRRMPLLARKQVLKKLISWNKQLHFSKHKVGNGIPFFKHACKLHWEGLIAKRAASAYMGKRSKDWLKFKCIMKQELVIGGFTEPRGSRNSFGALLVGYYKDKKLMFAGKVGTGFTEDVLKKLGARLKKLEVKKCPFDHFDESQKGVHWVKPIVVAEFEFAQWTRGGKLRVGRYKGLRDDKNAKDVVKEVPKMISIRK